MQLGGHEAPIEVELIGSLTLPEFIKALKDAYKDAGPRFCAIPVPQWKLTEARRKRALEKKKAGAEEGDGQQHHRVVLSRPVVIKSSNPARNCTIDMGNVSVTFFSHACDAAQGRRSIDAVLRPVRGKDWCSNTRTACHDHNGRCAQKSCMGIGYRISPERASPEDFPSLSLPSANSPLPPPQASLVIKGPSVSLEGVDLIGWGRPGLTWEESHGLVRTACRDLRGRCVHDLRAIHTGLVACFPPLCCESTGNELAVPRA